MEDSISANINSKETEQQDWPPHDFDDDEDDDIFRDELHTPPCAERRKIKAEERAKGKHVSSYFQNFNNQARERGREAAASKKSSNTEGKGKKVVVSPYFRHNNNKKKGVAEGGSASSSIKTKKKMQVVVVSPYFQNPGDNGGREWLERRAKKKAKLVVEAEAETKGEEALVSVSAWPSPSTPTRKGKNRGSGSSSSSRFNKFLDAYRRKSEDNNWIPPKLKDGLLQEKYYEDPWKVLVICMLLNKTQGNQAAKVISDLFELCPNPKAATEVETEKIERVISTLGLQKKRSMMIQRFSQEYLSDEWTHVTQLHGVGKYAADAYAIFCAGHWKDVHPEDHKLIPYWEDLWIIDRREAPAPEEWTL